MKKKLTHIYKKIRPVAIRLFKWKIKFLKQFGLTILGIILIVGLSFWAGASYQEKKMENAKKKAGPASVAARSYRATITDIKGAQITVKSSTNGVVQKYKITPSTVITDKGKTAKIDVLKKEQQLVVYPDRADTTLLERIVINPTTPTNNSRPNSIPAIPKTTSPPAKKS